jgi:hypothetical protein
MRGITGQEVRRALASLFIAVTIGFLVVITILIVTQPKFPLDIGLVRTTGRTGLFVTAVPAMVGIIGLALLWRKRRVGSILVTAYCAFWAIVFLGSLPQVWNARQSFCLKGLNFCIVSPWVARLTVLAIVTPFLLSGWWSLRQAADPSGVSRNGGDVHAPPN